jgi:hypothetical protein
MNHAGMPAHAELTRRQSLAALAVRLIWMQPAQQEAQTTRGSRRLLRMAHRGEAGAVLSSSSCPHAPPPPPPPAPGPGLKLVVVPIQLLLLWWTWR